MSFSSHKQHQDSGARWLGPIPSHWSKRRIKQLFEIKKRIAGADGFDVLSITQRGIRVKDVESNDGQVAADYLKYQFVEVGDFAMNGMDLLTGFVDIAQSRGVTSPDYRVFAVRDDTMEVYARFFLYLFQMAYTQKIFYGFGQGASLFGRWRLPTDQFNDFVCPLPPVAEQAAIAAFLDRETAKIDALVEEQRRLIELLKEKRQAVISHAVTKGLDPSAPMKDSGVEWLGEVPTHWEVGPVKRFFTSLDGRRIPLSAEERGGRSGEFPYYGASGIIDYIDDFLFDEDLVLVSEDGANLLNRTTPIAFVACGRYWVNNHAHILKPIDENRVFWAERVEALDLRPVVTGSAQPKLTADALANLIICVPPTSSERNDIEQAIAHCNGSLLPLLEEAERAIVLLQERRATLISTAVTGKIDVRGLVPAEQPATVSAKQAKKEVVA